MKAWKNHPNTYDDNLAKPPDDNSAINTYDVNLVKRHDDNSAINRSS